jgi:hypothetical protein
MIRKAILLSLIGLFCLTNLANAQSYSIKSLDGKEEKIKLYYAPASGMLTISCLRNTLMIDNYLAVDSVKVLNKIFLQINYAKRGGSNEGFGNQLLLHINKGKLCQTLHVNSYTNYDFRNTRHVKGSPNEYYLFKLIATLTGNNKDNYKLRLTIHNEQKSDTNRTLNHNYNRTEFLAFDKKREVFFSAYEYLKGYYLFHQSKEDKGGDKKYKEMDVPVVNIEKDHYYFIDGDWYTKGKENFYSISI